jgi:hypothetical protein
LRAKRANDLFKMLVILPAPLGGPRGLPGGGFLTPGLLLTGGPSYFGGRLASMCDERFHNGLFQGLGLGQLGCDYWPMFLHGRSRVVCEMQAALDSRSIAPKVVIKSLCVASMLAGALIWRSLVVAHLRMCFACFWFGSPGVGIVQVCNPRLQALTAALRMPCRGICDRSSRERALGRSLEI